MAISQIANALSIYFQIQATRIRWHNWFVCQLTKVQHFSFSFSIEPVIPSFIYFLNKDKAVLIFHSKPYTGVLQNREISTIIFLINAWI